MRKFPRFPFGSLGFAAAVLLLFTLITEGCAPSSPLPTVVPMATSTPASPSSSGPEPSGEALGQLAYVQGGDIWVKALPDGQPQRLTTDGHNREPHWSPSGQWLAFRKGDDQVWLIRAEGSAARALDEGAPIGAFAWAPAADRLAYTTGSGALMVVDADGSNPQELVTQEVSMPYRGVVRLAWSPGGTWLAYERIEQHGEEGPLGRDAGLWRIRADGSGATKLLDAGTETYEPILAGWSADGSRILYWVDPMFSGSLLADGAPLLALPADGGAPVELAKSVLAYPDFVVPGPIDSAQVAVIAGGYRGAWTGKSLHILSPTTGEDRALTAPDVAASSLAWSLDGQRIAYVAMPDRGDLGGGNDAKGGLMQRRIYVISAEGEPQPRQLTNDPAYRDEYPLWSADGSNILFARIDGQDRASLWLIQAEGGQPEQVVDELTPAPGWFGYYGHVEWGPLFDWWRGPVRQRVPPPSQAPTAVPVATPTAPTPPLSSPTLTETVPTTLAPGTNVVLICNDVYPGLPGCVSNESLVGGRLAFVDKRRVFNGDAGVIDLGKGNIWSLGKGSQTLIGWSPSGEYLLVTEDKGGVTGYTIYRYDGTEMRSFDNLAVPPFWAPPGPFPGERDRLAVPGTDGQLTIVPFPEGKLRPAIPPGGLGENGQGVVRWSLDGWLAWSLTTDQLIDAGQLEQTLYVQLAESGTPVATWRLSSDVLRRAYYQVIDWVPRTRLILAGRGITANSAWVDGAPLVSVNADTGQKTDLGAQMLLTSEAYAWHPTQPGLLALAEGGGRFLNENKRLALLDVTTGKLDTLTGEDMAAFEPAWSPDGKLLAYAAVRASPGATGNGDALEHTLDGRAIYIFDLKSRETRLLTHPGDGVDGWPQWSAGGTQLLYTRQQGGHTDVRVVWLDGSRDGLLVTGLADPMCYYGGCGWWRMLAYYTDH